jgi:hypothetical protein
MVIDSATERHSNDMSVFCGERRAIVYGIGIIKGTTTIELAAALSFGVTSAYGQTAGSKAAGVSQQGMKDAGCGRRLERQEKK